MHNTMYSAGSAKFHTRQTSPQHFANFSPPIDYPSAGVITHSSAELVTPSNKHNHHLSMSMRHSKGMSNKNRNTSNHHVMNSNTMGIMGAGSIGHYRGDLIFPDDLDSIELCMPQPAAPANEFGHSDNGEMSLMHGGNSGGSLCMGDGFTERRRRGHSRRSHHKVDVEQQVKWSRKNIAATMERFEPTNNQSSSSTSSLEYGFAAGVVTPLTTPSHHQSQVSPVQYPYPNGNGGLGELGTMGSINHVYSYAYYEPGAVKCHTNIPLQEVPTPPTVASSQLASDLSKSPPRNSIRALLAKSFRSKSNTGQSTSSSPSAEDRHTYTTRYGTTENLYEEVNEQKIRKVLSDNRIATSGVGNVKEELRRVQHNHFRVLDELNLSLEALIMPPTPPDISPSHADDDDEATTSAAATAVTAAVASGKGVSNTLTAPTAQRPRRGGLLGGASTSSSTSSQQRTLSQTSIENLSTTLNSIELKDHTHSSCINPEFDEGDLDSGFSGSGSSSGASYNESLRYFKTGTSNHMQTTTLPNNLRSCRSSAASATSTSKTSMASAEDQGIGMVAAASAINGCSAGCGSGVTTSVGHNILVSPINYARRGSDAQRSSGRSLTATIASAAPSTATGTKPKKSFWTIKP